MRTGKDIVIVVDYHQENLQFRWFSEATGEERTFSLPTCADKILQVVQSATAEVGDGGQVVWIMESTTGWARVKRLLQGRVRFRLANVLQMPLPPKAHRKKTDKIDTGRILREYLVGTLPYSHQPPADIRQFRRLVDTRQDLVRRRTTLRNWINRYLSHETWEDRRGLWSQRGMKRLAAWIAGLQGPDVVTLQTKWAELQHVAVLLEPVERAIQELYAQWPAAQRLSAIRGLGVLSSVTILARIGRIERFANAEALISYAGLAPGVRQSDQTCRTGHIGGGGTDRQLRCALIEASMWARQIPRYCSTYERVAGKRGAKIGRLVVARLLLRSVYKMLTTGTRFNQAPAA